MTIEAHLADGRVLQFPDGTDPAVVQRTVKTLLGQAEPNRSLLGSVNNFAGGVSDAITQGATLGFADEAGAGVRALARAGTNLIQGKDADLSGNYDRALTDIRGREKQFAEQHPTASAVGNIVGGLATGKPTGPIAASGVPTTIARSAATGAGMGAVGGFGAGEGGFQNRLNSAVEGATFGGALGAGIPAAAGVVSRVVSPFRNQLTPEAQRLAQVAKTEGIPLSAAQASGSRPLQSLEAFFETHPMTASTQQAESQAQRRAFNWAALRRIEESGDDLSPAVLSRARDRISDQIENLVAQTRVKPDKAFSDDLADAVTEYGRRLDAMKKPVFDTFVSDISDMMSSGGMPGKTYQSTRSTLSQMAQGAGGNDPYFAQALRALRDTLDKAADRSMPDPLKGDWADARRLWGNLRTLEKAMSNTTTQAASGNLSPTQLALAVAQQHPRGGYSRGYGPMNDLSRVGTEFVRPQIPNSGTPERLFWQNLLTNPIGITGAIGAGAAVDPLVGGGGAALALLGPRAAQMAYNTPLIQAYVRNQRLAGASPALRQGLLGGFAGAAGGGLLGQ